MRVKLCNGVRFRVMFRVVLCLGLGVVLGSNILGTLSLNYSAHNVTPC